MNNELLDIFVSHNLNPTQRNIGESDLIQRFKDRVIKFIDIDRQDLEKYILVMNILANKMIYIDLEAHNLKLKFDNKNIKFVKVFFVWNLEYNWLWYLIDNKKPYYVYEADYVWWKKLADLVYSYISYICEMTSIFKLIWEEAKNILYGEGISIEHKYISIINERGEKVVDQIHPMNIKYKWITVLNWSNVLELIVTDIGASIKKMNISFLDMTLKKAS